MNMVFRHSLLAGVSFFLAYPAHAADSKSDSSTASADAQSQDGQNANRGGQANDAQSLTTSDIVVTGHNIGERAPVTASLATTQPQAVVSRDFIENSRPVSSDFNDLISLTPSVSMTAGNNGPGLGESKVTIRGFQDGEYNVTYDSIPFSDTNNPTHHSTSFFPSNTIETAVVDRGPGNASQLGQATYGGNINLYSRAAKDEMGGSADLTYGSFNTLIARAELQSGAIPSLGGAKFVVTGEFLRSDGALTWSPTHSKNIFAKGVFPLGPSNTLTLVGTYNANVYYQSDTGTGTCGNITGENCLPNSAIAQFGKNFALTNDNSISSPYAQDYWKYNRTSKQTDFEIVRLQSDLGDGLTLDNRVYMYGYTNHTLSGQDGTGSTPNTVILSPGAKAVPGIPGYDKLNKYRNYGYIGQVDYTFSRGRFRAGGWYEHSNSNRFTIDYDMTTGQPNYRETPLKYVSQGGAVPNGIPQPPANIAYLQDSSWDQFQLFAELEYRPFEALSITPGIKYIHFARGIDAEVNQKSRTPIDTSATWTDTLPFVTANLKIQPDWTAYFQFAKGFYVPDLSSFYSSSPTLLTSLDALQPQKTTNYQLGTVYHGRHFAVDGDIYQIDVSNKISANPVGDGTLINIGGVRYRGVEGQVSLFPVDGLTLFANGSLNQAANRDTDRQIANAPFSTAAIGIFYRIKGFNFSFDEKYTGARYATEATPGVPFRLYRLSPYGIGTLAGSYTFGRIRLGMSIYNLFDDRTVTTLKTSSKGAPTTVIDGTPVQSGYGPNDQLNFNAPRTVQGTIKILF